MSSASNRRVSRIVTAWIATFSILLATLAPSFSFAYATSPQPSGAVWNAICSAGGSGGAATPRGNKNIFHLKHCPQCFKQDQTGGMPPASQPLSAPRLTGAMQLPILFYRASQPLPVWSARHSRAPPVLS